MLLLVLVGLVGCTLTLFFADSQWRRWKKRRHLSDVPGPRSASYITGMSLQDAPTEDSKLCHKTYSIYSYILYLGNLAQFYDVFGASYRRSLVDIFGRTSKIYGLFGVSFK